jgi:DNA topoisomerase-2
MATTQNQLSKTYQKKTDIEHILDAPDTYIGSIENEEVNNWTFDEPTNLLNEYHISVLMLIKKRALLL